MVTTETDSDIALKLIDANLINYYVNAECV